MGLDFIPQDKEGAAPQKDAALGAGVAPSRVLGPLRVVEVPIETCKLEFLPDILHHLMRVISHVVYFYITHHRNKNRLCQTSKQTACNDTLSSLH